MEYECEVYGEKRGVFSVIPPPPSGLSPPPVEAVAAATSVHVFIH